MGEGRDGREALHMQHHLKKILSCNNPTTMFAKRHCIIRLDEGRAAHLLIAFPGKRCVDLALCDVMAFSPVCLSACLPVCLPSCF